ncbi:MAG: hypothetical protein ACSNEK_04775 [Parachlamydiaceae bacterium]
MIESSGHLPTLLPPFSISPYNEKGQLVSLFAGLDPGSPPATLTGRIRVLRALASNQGVEEVPPYLSHQESDGGKKENKVLQASFSILSRSSQLDVMNDGFVELKDSMAITYAKESRQAPAKRKWQREKIPFCGVWKRESSIEQDGHTCTSCQVTRTIQWRKSKRGKILCNACGLREKKSI